MQHQASAAAEGFKCLIGVQTQGVELYVAAFDRKPVCTGVNKRQHIADEIVHSPPFLADCLKKAFLFFHGGGLTAFAAGKNDGERGAQFMGCCGDKLCLCLMIFF